MKKVLAFVAITLLCGSLFADSLSITDELKKIPALKQGVAYSINDCEVMYLSTVEVAKYKGISLEAGYSTTDKAVLVVSYNLLKLKDIGVTLPILDLVEFNLGMYAGIGRIGVGPGNAKDNNSWTYGPSLTLLNVKF